MISRAVMPTRRNRTWVFLWIALFLMGILLQYGVALGRPGLAIAASGLKAGTVHDFEVDGDLASGNGNSNPGDIPAALIDDLSNGDDWFDGASGVGVVDPEDPPHSFLDLDPIESSNDDVYKGGNKETDTRDWAVQSGPKPPAKDDIRHSMAYAKFVGTSAFFYVGATRIVNNGDTHIDFELNRKPFKTWADGESKPNRSVGDVLISLEFSNGGSDPIVTVYKVTDVVNHPNGQETSFSADLASAAAVHSATNFIDLADQGLGYAVPSFEFAEASIDLGALGINTGCPGLSTGHIRTRAGGDLDSSQLKDAVSPFPIDLNNCGKLRIIKEDPQGGLLGGAEFTINPNPIPGGDDPLVIADDDSNDDDGTNGEIEIDPAKPGEYEVCETKAPTGYKLPADPCKIKTLDPNGTVSFTFVDPPKVASTTLTPVQFSPLDGSFVAVGDTITLRVRETNTGESILTNVHVTGTNSCADWTPVGASAPITLDPGEDQVFECVFDAPADDDFTWTALGHGTDEKGDPAPAANEDESGSYDVLMPATTLSVKTAPPAAVHAGDSITIVVTETNSGEGTISNVTVTGVNSCANWVAAGFDGDLSPDESVDFSCTFDAPSDDFGWSADGHGTDALSDPVPAAGEHVEGTVDVVKPATTLTLKGSVPPTVHAGDPVTITVTETNTGDGSLHDVTVVSEGGDCVTWTPAAGFSGTLAAGASVDFTCSITAPGDGDDIAWSALGKGNDSLDAAAPETNERQGGEITVIRPATVLSIKTNAPAKVHAGDPITIVVTEANSGDDTLSAVHVDGGGACTTWTAAASKNGGGIFIGALAPGESVDFTCSFDAPADGSNVTWSADGKGTDSLGSPAPATDEHQDGAIVVILPATTLTLVSEVPDPILENGTTVITVRETNTGDDTLSGVNVVNLDGDSDCTAGWVASATKVGGGAFSGSLAPGEAVDFWCTITAGETDVVWNALGRGTDSLGAPAPAANEDEAGDVHVVNPDIDIVKTAGASLQSQELDGAIYTTLDGSTVVYKYVVTTLDPDGLTDIEVTDDLCAPVSYVSGDTLADGKLVPGESWIFQCSSVLTIADDGTDVHNVATASGQPLLGDRVDETDDADVHLRHPAVIIDKDEDDADDLVFPGQVVAYTLTLNVTDGPTDLVVTDDLPAGVTYVADSASDGGTEAAGLITWNLTDVATGTKTLTYQVTVVAESGTLPNHAEACVPAFNDFEEDCDDADDEVRVPGLGITKAVSEEDLVVARGQTVSYTITVNVTDGPFTDVVITDTLPDGQTIVGGSADSTPEADEIVEGVSIIIWEFDSLDGVATLTYDVTIDADAPNGPQENVAVVCVAELESCDEDDVTIRVPSLTILKDLTAGNTGGDDPDLGPLAKVGDVLTYTLSYTLADGPVTDAVITDPVRPGLQYVPGSASDGGSLIGVDADGNGGTVTWNFPTLSDSGTVTYQVLVLESAVDQAQPIVNTATIVSNETPPDDDDATVGVNPPPSVASPSPTLPSTDTPGTGGGTSGGSGLALILLLAVGILGGIGILAPAPARRRMRDRD
jgi:fimbrial isopeptide formation D2 family protein/uncharacterized repeat protein (TIGR01451 family)